MALGFWDNGSGMGLVMRTVGPRDAVTDVFLDALAMAALEQLQHFSARQLATLAYNYGTLNHWGRNDQELLDAITIRMLHQHQVASRKDIRDVMRDRVPAEIEGGASDDF